jgi:hypothetical protein
VGENLVESSFLAFVTFTAVLVVTPGSTTAVVVRNTLEGGRRAGYLTALGAAIANTTIAIACGLGLSLLLAVWPGSLTAIKIGGAVFLAWLGISSLYRAFRHADGGIQLTLDLKDEAPRSHAAAYVGDGLSLGCADVHPGVRIALLLLRAGGHSRQPGARLPRALGDRARCVAAILRGAVDAPGAAGGDRTGADRSGAPHSRRFLDPPLVTAKAGT